MSNTTNIEKKSIAELRPFPGNARTHSKSQIRKLAASIKEFGFLNPVLIDDENRIIAGHGRVAAAKLLNLNDVPTLRISHLSEEQRRAYVIADNKLATMGGWNPELLAFELNALAELNFDFKITGFNQADIATLVDPPRRKTRRDIERDNRLPALCEDVVSRQGDMWLLGPHRLRCGDPQDPREIDELMGSQEADAFFTTAPSQFARGSQPWRANPSSASPHADQASGDFRDFLNAAIGNGQGSCRAGGVVFLGTHWRDYVDVVAVGTERFGEPLDLCVWTSDRGLPGQLYSSNQELILVLKNGVAEPGRASLRRGPTPQRSNVWTYAIAGARRSPGLRQQTALLQAKPVALVADAVQEATTPRGIVLDVFGGAGSTLIAAEKTGRVAHLIEHDPRRCDLIVRRYQAYAGDQARLGATGPTFGEVERARSPSGTNSAALH